MKPMESRLWAAALAVTLAASLAIAPPAGAKPRGNPGWGWGPGPGRGRGYAEGQRWRYIDRSRPVRYVIVRRPRMVLFRPASRDYFLVRRPRFVVVRPLPYWPAPYGNGVSARIGIHTRGLDLNFGLRQASPLYGCNFCDSYFTSYSAWERHVQSCPYAPRERVLCEPWDEGDVQYFRDGARQAWDSYQGGSYDGRYDDGRYDGRYDDGRGDDRGDRDEDDGGYDGGDN